MEDHHDLEYLINNDCTMICEFLTTDDFVKFCKERAIDISRERLEKFEELGVFFPIARVGFPIVERKMQTSENGHVTEDHGVLKEGDEWDGEIKLEYARFLFTKEQSRIWYEQKFMWDPTSKPFSPWNSFKDNDGNKTAESYYSKFQCYHLSKFINLLSVRMNTEEFLSPTADNSLKIMKNIAKYATIAINSFKDNIIEHERIPYLCQVLANRYYPLSQTDRRTYRLSRRFPYSDEDWFNLCSNWNADNVLSDLELQVDDIKRFHKDVVIETHFVDPLMDWYDLLSFISLDKRKKLKGKALYAQTLYSMEFMLRAFYKDLTGLEIKSPDEWPNWDKDRFYGVGVSDDELRYLEFLTNEYHLNPRPKLILVVEGESEQTQFPRLSSELLGHDFGRLGIEIVQLGGIGNFEGKKSTDRYGALEKFIDYHHSKQTIVFIILDNEGKAEIVRNRLLKATSKFYTNRKVTKEEYVILWERNIEFDNFSAIEIADAMTNYSENRYKFTEEEILQCINNFKRNKGDNLEILFTDNIDFHLSKTALLKILIDKMIANRDNEFDENNEGVRPISRILHRVTELASFNHQPHTTGIWKDNQESGYLGDIVE